MKKFFRCAYLSWFKSFGWDLIEIYINWTTPTEFWRKAAILTSPSCDLTSSRGSDMVRATDYSNFDSKISEFWICNDTWDPNNRGLFQFGILTFAALPKTNIWMLYFCSLSLTNSTLPNQLNWNVTYLKIYILCSWESFFSGFWWFFTRLTTP